MREVKGATFVTAVSEVSVIVCGRSMGAGCEAQLGPVQNVQIQAERIF